MAEKTSLMVEAVRAFEILVSFYQTTWHNIPEDSHLHICHCENLKSYIILIVYSCNCGTPQAKNGLESPWFSIITEMFMVLL
jgi:hypothetical protein